MQKNLTLLKIFIFIFNFSIFSESILKSELNSLKKEIELGFKNNQYKENIPKLKKIIQFSEEPKYKLWLGLSYFFREDLEIPKEDDEVFIRNKKISILKENYILAKQNILAYLNFLEDRSLLKTESKTSEYYFILSIIEYQLNDPKSSKFYLKKSHTFGFKNKNILDYNMQFL